MQQSLRYRVEVVKKRGGRFWMRQQVGEGYSNRKKIGTDIYLEIPPYNAGHLLVITIAEEKDDE